MNGIRCPKCDLVNLLRAESCHRCGTALADLPATAQVSVPVDQIFQAQAYSAGGPSGPQDNETGRKTFFWYRIYIGAMLALYAAVAIGGLVFAVMSTSFAGREQEDALMMGIIYGIFGMIFAAVYGVALFLPRKPFNWIVGIVMIAIGLSSCCLLPATVPLIIFWLKPETRAYFGRE